MFFYRLSEMRTDIKHLLLISLLLFPLNISGHEDLKRGLFFRSFEVDKDMRTCLNLTPGKSLSFENSFSMEFDINLRRREQNFGYVFRIIGNDTLNIDFLANLDSRPSLFSLVVKNRAVIQYEVTETGSMVDDTWIKVLLELNLEGKSISLTINGVKKEAVYPFNNIKTFGIYFGGNKHEIFSTTDIAPMTIRDIRLFDTSSKLIRYWKLGLHSYDAVYDDCDNAKATVLNPQWEIDKHVNWSKQKSFLLSGIHYGIAYDEINDRIFIVKDKNIIIYDAASHTIDSMKVRNGIPYNTEFNHLFYNPAKNELVSYQFESDHLATFNFHTSEWNNDNNEEIPPFHWHHGSNYLPGDSQLVTFGGYGYHRYNGMLYTHSAGSWKNYDLSATISPRYLGGMGYMGNKEMLYFGGFGNESGRQEEFPRNYYDLYIINIDSVTVRKAWDLPQPEEPFTSSNSLVIDKNKRKFYALSYPNKRYASVIKLHEYSIDKPEYRVVGDSIPYFFNDIESYCDLFQSFDGSELFAVTSSVKDGTTEIDIYSIAYPPLNIDDYSQHLPENAGIRWFFWVLMAFTAMAFAFFAIYKKRRSGKNETDDAKIELIPGNEDEPIIYDSFFAEKKHSSINLLGNFRVIDDRGDDITVNFTPITTQLFLLLLMSTIKNGKGITSQELKKILWFDKSDDSARNNRNVYINKLRSILKSLEGIKVESHNNYWTIQSDKKIFCDYERAMALLKTLQAGNQSNIRLLTELADIALEGTLLPFLQQSEWVESYQSDYANQLIECLMSNSKRDEVKANLLLLLKIADVILLHDNTDEEAIRLKCYALFRSGRKNQALQAFNKFSTDYENLLATKHNLVFDDLVT